MAPLADGLQPDRTKEPSSISSKDILEILQNVKDKHKLASILSGDNTMKRRSTWSALTNAPYYKEPFALQLKAVLDEMIQEHANGILEDRIWRCEEFDMKISSLYVRINQSKLFLLNELDADGIYKSFCDRIVITKERGIGVRLSYIRDISPESFKPNKAIDKMEQTVTWKDKIEQFCENSGVGDTLEINKLALTDDDIADVHSSLAQLQDIVGSISSERIFLARLSKEEADKLR